jgi:hypothetical protein
MKVSPLKALTGGFSRPSRFLSHTAILAANCDARLNSTAAAYRAHIRSTPLASTRGLSTAISGTQRRLSHTGAQEVEPEQVTAAPSPEREFWRNVPQYRDVEEKDFLKYRWTVSLWQYQGHWCRG